MQAARHIRHVQCGLMHAYGNIPGGVCCICDSLSLDMYVLHVRILGPSFMTSMCLTMCLLGCLSLSLGVSACHFSLSLSERAGLVINPAHNTQSRTSTQPRTTADMTVGMSLLGCVLVQVT